MSKPSEEILTDEKNIDSVSEGIMQTGDKVAVEHDDKTIKDDLSDYVYLNPRRKKHYAHSGSSSHYKGHHSSHHRHSSSRRRMKAWKKALISIGAMLLALILVLVAIAVILVFKGHSDLFDEDVDIMVPDKIGAVLQDDGKYVEYNGETYKLNENITNMLFMGVDKRDIDDLGSNGTGGQADVIVVMAIDTKQGKTTLISVPRDIMTDVAVYSVSGTYTGMTTQQLCLSYAYGDGKETSCENTLASVRRIFYNIPIKSYFALDLDGIAAMNDSVGGVDVVSPETIGDFVEGESYHLEGSAAERFVRTRRMDIANANLLRTKRQQIYAKAFMSKVISSTKKDITVPVSMFNESAPYSCTNLNASKISYLAKEVVMGNGMDFDIVTVPVDVTLNEEENHAEYYIKDKEFYEQFLSVYYEKV